MHTSKQIQHPDRNVTRQKGMTIVNKTTLRSYLCKAEVKAGLSSHKLVVMPDEMIEQGEAVGFCVIDVATGERRLQVDVRFSILLCSTPGIVIMRGQRVRLAMLVCKQSYTRYRNVLVCNIAVRGLSGALDDDLARKNIVSRDLLSLAATLFHGFEDVLKVDNVVPHILHRIALRVLDGQVRGEVDDSERLGLHEELEYSCHLQSSQERDSIRDGRAPRVDGSLSSTDRPTD